MQRIIFTAMMGILLLGTNLQAAITEVLLFPTGAVISAESTLDVSHQQATFQLPQTAAPDSLQITPAGQGRIINYQVNSVVIPATGLSELEKQLTNKKVTRQQLSDKQTINNTGLEYWNNQKSQQLKTSQDIETLGTMIIAATTPMVLEASRLAAELAKIDAEIQELERQLAQRKGHTERLWQVTVQVTTETPQRLPIRYQYRIGSARWQSHYTIAARPGADQIDWLWQAQLQQSSGEDWKNIELKIATSEPNTTLTPPAVSPWVIRERQLNPLVRAQSLNKRSDVAAMADSAELMAPAAETASAFSRAEGELFDIYTLGKQTVIAGQTTTLTIAEGQWQTEFSYLFRPHYSTQVFLSADISADEQVNLPNGPAALMVDGVLVGKRNFSFHGKEQTLFFGADPAIASKVSKKDLADRNGLFNKKRTLAWDMSVAVTNNKSYSVDLRIEDAYPRVSDKRIELAVLESGDGQEGDQQDGIISWNRQIDPGQTSRLDYGYDISYPEEMQVIPGR